MAPRKLPYEAIRELCDGERSSTEIAAILGIKSARSVETLMRNQNWPRRKPGPPSGEKNPFWSGGRVVDRDGYVLVLATDHPNARKSGYMLEHRLVMERMIGRYLRPDEVIDHIDGNKLNNTEENLRLFRTNGEHLSETLFGHTPNWSEEGKSHFVGRYSSIDEPIDTHTPKKKQGEIRRQQILRAHELREKDAFFSSEMAQCYLDKQGYDLHKTKRDLLLEVQKFERIRAPYKRE